MTPTDAPAKGGEKKAHAIDMLRQMVADDIKRNGPTGSFMIRNGLLADLLDELAEHREFLDPAEEIGRLVNRILDLAPAAGLFAEIAIKPHPTGGNHGE